MTADNGLQESEVTIVHPGHKRADHAPKLSRVSMAFRFLRRPSLSRYWTDISWLASGNAVAQILGILALPLLTRLFTPTDFGLQNLFIRVVGFSTVILTLRYEYFIQLPKYDDDAKGLVRVVLWLSVLGALIASPIVWAYRGVLAHALGDPALATWLPFVPLTAALISLSIAVQHWTQRRKNYPRASISELAGRGAYVGTALTGYWVLPGAAGLILAHAGAALGKIIWLTRSVKRRPHANHGVNSGRVKDKRVNDENVFSGTIGIAGLRRAATNYFRLSGSMVFSHLMLACTSAIPPLYIAHAYGAQTLGQFALVISTIFLPSSLIGNAIGQVYYQRAAERWARGESFIDLWYSTVKLLLYISLPLYLGIALVSPSVFPFIFGRAWADAGQYAALMAIGAAFSFLTSPLDRACLVVGAWQYVPLWHTARAVTTGLVAWLASVNEWDIHIFLTWLVAQMTVMYLIDFWAEWRFASRDPVHSS